MGQTAGLAPCDSRCVDVQCGHDGRSGNAPPLGANAIPVPSMSTSSAGIVPADSSSFSQPSSARPMPTAMLPARPLPSVPADVSDRGELLRLRAENQRLRERNQTLLERPDRPAASSTVTLGGDEAAGSEVAQAELRPLRAAARNARMLPPAFQDQTPLELEPADATADWTSPECLQDPSSGACLPGGVAFLSLSDVPTSCLQAGWAVPRVRYDGAGSRDAPDRDGPARGWGGRQPQKVCTDEREDTQLFGRRTTGGPVKVRQPVMIGAKSSSPEWRREAGPEEAGPDPSGDCQMLTNRIKDDRMPDRSADRLGISHRSTHDAEASNSSMRRQVFLDNTATPGTSDRLLPGTRN